MNTFVESNSHFNIYSGANLGHYNVPPTVPPKVEHTLDQTVTARLVQLAADDLNTEILPHPILRIWLHQTFFFSQILKKQLKGNHFDSDEEVILACANWFSSKTRVFYSQGLFKVKQRWQKCINSGVGYIEKE